MKRIHFHQGEVKFHDAIELKGIGIKETMPRGLIVRPSGMDYFLLIHFHTSVLLDLGAGPFHAEPNTTVLWHPGQAHCFGNDSQRWSHSWILIRGGAASRIFNASEIPPRTALTANGGRTMVPFLEMMYGELTSHNPAYPVILENLLDIIAISIGRAIGDHPAIPERFCKVRRYIDGNLHRYISLSELAGVAGLSQSHFSAMFTKCMKVAPLRYVEQQRMRLAAFLLADAHLTVSEVAARVSYADPLYFSRRFHKQFGQSPSSFRGQAGIY